MLEKSNRYESCFDFRLNQSSPRTSSPSHPRREEEETKEELSSVDHGTHVRTCTSYLERTSTHFKGFDISGFGSTMLSRQKKFCDPVGIESICYHTRVNWLIDESNMTEWLRKIWTGCVHTFSILLFPADLKTNERNLAPLIFSSIDPSNFFSALQSYRYQLVCSHTIADELYSVWKEGKNWTGKRERERERESERERERERKMCAAKVHTPFVLVVLFLKVFSSFLSGLITLLS